MGKRTISWDDKKKMAEFYDAGWPVMDIAHHFGASHGAVCNAAKCFAKTYGKRPRTPFKNGHGRVKTQKDFFEAAHIELAKRDLRRAGFSPVFCLGLVDVRHAYLERGNQPGAKAMGPMDCYNVGGQVVGRERLLEMARECAA